MKIKSSGSLHTHAEVKQCCASLCVSLHELCLAFNSSPTGHCCHTCDVFSLQRATEKPALESVCEVQHSSIV